MQFSFDFTENKFQKILTNNPNVMGWYNALNDTLPDYDIITLEQVAAFLAQTMHESNNFNVLEENLNYRAERLLQIFPKYFPDINLANTCARNPTKTANIVYANRMGNGPSSSGDGYKFRGGGLIQLTGRNNYTKFGASVGMSAEDATFYVRKPEGAVKSSCWFWKENNLNNYVSDMVALTKKINGGTNGLSERIANYNRILPILRG